MLSKERVLEVLKEAGVLQEGHFLLTSGRHSNKYLQCAKIFCNTKYSEELCADLANKFKNDDVEVVIGPAMGAVQMAYEVSRALKCKNFFTERDENGKMTLRRGFAIVREVINLVKEAGGVVVGVGSIVDRTDGKIDFDVPYKAVYSADVVSWEAANCPLCRESGLPLVKPGSRKIK